MVALQAETVQLLLNAGANPNIRYLVTDSSPLVEMANQVYRIYRAVPHMQMISGLLQCVL